MVETERIVEWLRRLVQIPSIGPENAGTKSGKCDEGQIAAQIAEWFRAFGGEVEQEDVFPGRPNTYSIWRGKTNRWIAVDVHIDTVGIETMLGDPFDGRLENGRVYGRGAVDTKASLAIILALLEDLQRRGETLQSNLLVCASVAEETGCVGAPIFANWVRRHDLELDELLVAEPTMCIPIYGHKGGVNIVFEIEGSAAHSSQPHLGKNAISAAASLIEVVDEEQRRLSSQPATTAVGVPTVAVTMISGGQALNVVPDRCRIYVNRRVVPGENPPEIAAALYELGRRACPLPLTMTTIHELGAFYQPPDTPWIKRLSTWSGMEPATVSYGTNASGYERLAHSTVIFGPGSIDQAHRDVEWVEVSQLEKAAEIYARWWDLA